MAIRMPYTKDDIKVMSLGAVTELALHANTDGPAALAEREDAVRELAKRARDGADTIMIPLSRNAIQNMVLERMKAPIAHMCSNCNSEIE